ncbi:unnamed protein product [Trichobilharzia regenti]|nr:unnamed protein product [Trichobilharzia regenti]
MLIVVCVVVAAVGVGQESSSPLFYLCSPVLREMKACLAFPILALISSSVPSIEICFPGIFITSVLSMFTVVVAAVGVGQESSSPLFYLCSPVLREMKACLAFPILALISSSVPSIEICFPGR